MATYAKFQTKVYSSRLIILTLMVILAGFWATTLTEAQSRKKPISKDGLIEAIKLNALSTKELVQHIERRGVSFQLTAQDEAELRQAGARPEVVDAVRRSYRPGEESNPVVTGNTPSGHNAPAPRASNSGGVPAGDPLSKNEIVTLLQSGVPVARVEQFVEARGVSFALNPEVAREISTAGGNRSLLGAISERMVASNSAPASRPAASTGTNASAELDYDDLTDDATDAIKREDYTRAIRSLKQAINLDQTQPTAYALLGIAHLYGQDDPLSAKPAMRSAIERGGGAVFRVYHDHDGFFKTFCEGSFFVTKAGMTFKADDGNHTFEAEDVKLAEVKLNGFVGSEYGAFHVKVDQGGKKPQNYNFAPATQKRAESNLIIELIKAF